MDGADYKGEIHIIKQIGQKKGYNPKTKQERNSSKLYNKKQDTEFVTLCRIQYNNRRNLMIQ